MLHIYFSRVQVVETDGGEDKFLSKLDGEEIVPYLLTCLVNTIELIQLSVNCIRRK